MSPLYMHVQPGQTTSSQLHLLGINGTQSSLLLYGLPSLLLYKAELQLPEKMVKKFLIL